MSTRWARSGSTSEWGREREREELVLFFFLRFIFRRCLFFLFSLCAKPFSPVDFIFSKRLYCLSPLFDCLGVLLLFFCSQSLRGMKSTGKNKKKEQKNLFTHTRVMGFPSLSLSDFFPLSHRRSASFISCEALPATAVAATAAEVEAEATPAAEEEGGAGKAPVAAAGAAPPPLRPPLLLLLIVGPPATVLTTAGAEPPAPPAAGPLAVADACSRNPKTRGTYLGFFWGGVFG